MSGTTPTAGGGGGNVGMSIPPEAGQSLVAPAPTAGGTGASGTGGGSKGTSGNTNAFDKPMGELNTLRMPLTDAHYDDQNDFFNLVGYASTRLRAVDVLGPGPFKAVCLRTLTASRMERGMDAFDSAQRVVDGAKGLPEDKKESELDDIERRKKDFKRKGADFMVVARVPELHQMLQIPSEEGDYAIIGTYPKFMPVDSNMAMPSPGDIIWVNYTNLETLEGPVYQGVIHKHSTTQGRDSGGGNGGTNPEKKDYAKNKKPNVDYANTEHFGQLPPECVSSKPRSDKIDMIILHDGGTYSAQAGGAVQDWSKKCVEDGIKVSSHYFIEHDGEVYQLVPEEYVTYHANQQPCSPPKTNKRSVGVDLARVASGDLYETRKYKDKDGNKYTAKERGYSTPYTAEQYTSLKYLLAEICDRHGMSYSTKTIVGHAWQGCGAKGDPVKGFDWDAIDLNDPMKDCIGVDWDPSKVKEMGAPPNGNGEDKCGGKVS